MTWGGELQTLLEIKKNTGVVPKALRSRPALKSSNRAYLEAFYELSAGRQAAEAPQAITTADITAYCELFRISSLDERSRFFSLIRALDRVYLKTTHERIKRDLDAVKPKG